MYVHMWCLNTCRESYILYTQLQNSVYMLYQCQIVRQWYTYVPTRDETILQCINTLQYLLLQYITIQFKKIRTYLLHIAIYCDLLIVKDLVSVQSLHCKNYQTSGNLDYTLQFLTIYIMVKCIVFSSLLKPTMIMKIKIQSHVAVRSNIIIIYICNMKLFHPQCLLVCIW